MTFEERVSMQIRYLGADTLTLVMENGTILDTNKLGAPYGGTITVISTVLTTIEGIPALAEWRLGVVDVAAGKLYTTELDGVESKVGSGDILYSDLYVADTNVVLQIIEPGYEERLIYFTLQSTPQTVIVELELETND